jgi:hypothetical protein
VTYQSIQLGADNKTPVDDDFANHLHPVNTVDRAARSGIQTNSGGAQRITMGGGVTNLSTGESNSVTIPFTSTKERVGGYETDAKTAQNLAKAFPEMENTARLAPQGVNVAVQPTADEAAAARAALRAEAEAAQAAKVELNAITNPLGAQVMEAVAKVDQGLLTRTLIGVQRGEDVTKHLKSAADQMGVSTDHALGYLTIATDVLGKQVERAAAAQGITDYPAFTAWAAKQPDGRSISAMVTHAKVRDVSGVWGEMFRTYKRSGGR